MSAYEERRDLMSVSIYRDLFEEFLVVVVDMALVSLGLECLWQVQA